MSKYEDLNTYIDNFAIKNGWDDIIKAKLVSEDPKKLWMHENDNDSLMWCDICLDNETYEIPGRNPK